MKKIQGKLFIISGPSQMGKDTIVQKLIKIKRLKLNSIVTNTTRVPRPGEKPGKELNFLTTKQFKLLIKNKKLLEWAHVRRALFGTLKEPILNKLINRKNILMTVNVDGAIKIKSLLPQNTILIFITAESNQEVKRRIFLSTKMTMAQKKFRWCEAQRELKFKPLFNFIVINRWNKLPQTLQQIKKIITSQLTKPLTKSQKLGILI
ncbi:MAG: hypothetical protein V1712_03335 [Patescibacteria group bacterium]